MVVVRYNKIVHTTCRIASSFYKLQNSKAKKYSSQKLLFLQIIACSRFDRNIDASFRLE